MLFLLCRICMRLFTGKRARARGAAGPLRQSNHLLAKSCALADRLRDSHPARDRPEIRSNLAAVKQEGSGARCPCSETEIVQAWSSCTSAGLDRQSHPHWSLRCTGSLRLCA